MTERTAAEVFVELADTLIDDFDVVDFLHQVTIRCAEVLGVSAAGRAADRPARRAAGGGRLHRAEPAAGAAPAADRRGPLPGVLPHRPAHRGRPTCPPSTERWPRFAGEAIRSGFASVHALPMRLRSEVIGALNLFGTRTGALDDGHDPARSGARRRRHDRAAAGARHPPPRDPRRTAADRAQQPHRHRAGQGRHRRTAPARHGPVLRPAAPGRPHRNRRLSDLARAVIDGSVVL